MSAYELQKAIRRVNREPAAREAFAKAPEDFAAALDLTDDEKAALVARDYGRLYALGVHGLLLRPFSIIHQVSEAAYLDAIRASRTS